jgi:ubiquinone/menaquinone biosynthesis C-methylase UbiE
VGGLAAGGLLALPYAAPYVLPNVRSSLDLYVGYFEFYAGPYYLLKEIGRWWTGEDVSKTLGPALRIVFLSGIPVLAAVAWRFRWSVAGALLAGWAWFLMTSTTVHPWYLLAPTFLLPVVIEATGRGDGRSAGARRVGALQVGAWGALAAGSAFSYALYGGGVGVYWFSVIAGWAVWLVLQTTAAIGRALPPIMRRRGRNKWTWLTTHVGSVEPGDRLLDVGAGEGFVGAAARQSTGADVVLCDVTDFNRTDLPLVLSDGRTLPFETRAADVVVLAFVLHHTENAEQVVAEVHRVLRPGGRAAVLESVAESAWDRQILHVLDPLANRLRSDGLMAAQEEFLRFRSADVWREIFRRSGFRVLSEDRRGRVLHKQHLFILEKAETD